MQDIKVVTIRKAGLFYNAFDEDARIISYFFGYVIKNGAIGFPDNALAKVLNKLDEKSIDYNVISKEPCEKHFKDLNRYDHYLIKANQKYDANKVIEEIRVKLNKLSDEDLLTLLNMINEVLDETS